MCLRMCACELIHVHHNYSEPLAILGLPSLQYSSLRGDLILVYSFSIYTE